MIVLLIMIGFIIAVCCFILSLYIKRYHREFDVLQDMFIANQCELDDLEKRLKSLEVEGWQRAKKNNNNRNNSNRNAEQ